MKKMKQIRILLVDDHRLVSGGLKNLLEPEFEIVGIVEDGRAMLAAVRKLEPNVLIADISMPLLNGLEAVEQLQKEKTRTKVIFLTMHLEVSYVKRAFEIGASAYVAKHSAPSELVTAIREVLKGHTYMSPMIAGKVLKSFLANSKSTKIKGRQSNLTPRQYEVLQLLSEGNTAKEIAALLYVSPRTVESHKYRIMKALNLHSHADLIRFALKSGIASL